MISNIKLVFLFFIILGYIEKAFLVDTSEKSYNIFYKNTRPLHIAMNDLFTVLKLNKHFKETAKMELMLTMHNNLLQIIETNHKLAETQNVTDKIAVNHLTKINQILFRILENSSSLDLAVPSYRETLTNEISIEKITNILFKELESFLNVTNNFQYSNNVDNIESFSKDGKKSSSTKKVKKIYVRNLKKWVQKEMPMLMNRRIYKSKKAKIKNFAFMVSVHVDHEFVCAGTIIHRDLVITCASCLEGINLSNTQDISRVVLRVGSDYTTYGGELINVIQIHIHPGFDPNTLANNLAILQMNSMIRIAKKRRKVRRIKLDTENALTYESVMMLGWGARKADNEPFEFQRLSYAHVDLYDLEDCKEVYSRFYVKDYNFCAGYFDKGSGACKNDIGDPAIVGGSLVGLVSYGPPLCGSSDAPTVFTKISHHSHWIESIIELSAVKPVTMRTTEGIMPQINLVVKSQDYPDEIVVLKQIIRDLDITNTSVLHDVINEGFDKEILDIFNDTTKKISMYEHPLANKSIIQIATPTPADHHTVIQTIKLTTRHNNSFTPFSHEVRPPDYIADYDAFVEWVDHYYGQTIRPTSPSFRIKTPNETTKYITDIIARGGPAYAKKLDDDTLLSSDNYEDSTGMSIEETTKAYIKPISNVNKLSINAKSMLLNERDKELSEERNMLNMHENINKNIDIENRMSGNNKQVRTENWRYQTVKSKFSVHKPWETTKYNRNFHTYNEIRMKGAFRKNTKAYYRAFLSNVNY